MPSSGEPGREFLGDGFDPRFYADETAGGEAPRRKNWHRVVAAIVALAFSLVVVSLGLIRTDHGLRHHLFGTPLQPR